MLKHGEKGGGIKNDVLSCQCPEAHSLWGRTALPIH